jgi:photosystem II stability/assembly factor-like uncharacterized protein
MSNEPIPVNDELSDADSSAAVYALAALPNFEPGKAGRAFAGHSGGLNRSEDGGQTWQDALTGLQLNGTFPVTSLIPSPEVDRDGHVFAGAPGGIVKSIDGGQSWRVVLLPPPAPMISCLAISPDFAHDSTIFAGTMEDGIFVSQTSGEHWTGWNFGLLDLHVLCLAISPDFSADETLYAGTETGIFRSTNGGRAWREVNLPFGFDAVLSLAISPTFHKDHRLYAGMENHGIWASEDEGEHWVQVGEEVITDPVNTILVSGIDVLAVTSISLWYSKDGGRQWINQLPELPASAEISSVLAPLKFTTGTMTLIGLSDGNVEVVKINS